MPASTQQVLRQSEPKPIIPHMLRASILSLLLLTGTAEAATPQATAYQSYRKQVDRLTVATWRAHRAELDPEGLRGQGHDLDHLIPARCAYAYGWPASEAAQAWNLRVIPASLNRSQGARGCRGQAPGVGGDY